MIGCLGWFGTLGKVLTGWKVLTGLLGLTGLVGLLRRGRRRHCNPVNPVILPGPSAMAVAESPSVYKRKSNRLDSWG